MDFLYIAFLVLIGVFLYILIRILGKIVKVVVTVLIIGLIALSVFGYLAYKDYQTIKGEYQESKNLFVFIDGSKITYAANTTGFSMIAAKNLSKADISRLQASMDAGDVETMAKGYYRLVVLSETRCNSTYKEISKEFKDNTLKPVTLAVHDQEGVIYPESMFFKFMKYMPRFVISLGLFMS